MRDAMSKGGTLTVETANVFLDDSYVDRHIGVQPGPYCMVAVSDTGMGMAADVKAPAKGIKATTEIAIRLTSRTLVGNSRISNGKNGFDGRGLNNAGICDKIAESRVPLTAGVIKNEIVNPDCRAMQLHNTDARLAQELTRLSDASAPRSDLTWGSRRARAHRRQR